MRNTFSATIFSIFILVFGSDADAQSSEAQQALTGNWRVSIQNPEREEVTTYLAIRPNRELICNAAQPDGCIFSWHNMPGQFQVARRRPFPGSQLVFRYDEIEAVRLVLNRLHIRHGWHHLSEETTLIQSEPGQLSVDRQSGTREQWQRLEPRITSLSISDALRTGDRPETGDYHPNDTLDVTLVTEYDAWWWGPNGNMRAHRPKFNIYVYGENLWGYHEAYFSDGIDIEPTRSRPILAEPDESGHRYVIGHSFSFVTWPNATPGRKTLIINGQEYAVDLIVPGYPAPDPVLTVEDYAYYGGDGVISPGEPFRIRAAFPRAPFSPPPPLDVLSPSSGRVMASLSLRPTNDPKVWTTGWQTPFKAAPEVAPNEEIEPTSPDTLPAFDRQLRGDWLITTNGNAGIGGVATIADDTSLSMTIWSPDRNLDYRSVATMISPGSYTQELGSYTAYLDTVAIAEEEAFPTPEFGPLLRLPHPEMLPIRFQGKEHIFPVDLASDDLDPFILRLKPNDHGQFEGSFRGGNGRETLLTFYRDAIYDQVIVTDQQVPSPNANRDYAYPYDADGVQIARNTRSLVIIGENLPDLHVRRHIKLDIIAA